VKAACKLHRQLLIKWKLESQAKPNRNKTLPRSDIKHEDQSQLFDKTEKAASLQVLGCPQHRRAAMKQLRHDWTEKKTVQMFKDITATAAKDCVNHAQSIKEVISTATRWTSAKLSNEQAKNESRSKIRKCVRSVLPCWTELFGRLFLAFCFLFDEYSAGPPWAVLYDVIVFSQPCYDLFEKMAYMIQTKYCKRFDNSCYHCKFGTANCWNWSVCRWYVETKYSFHLEGCEHS